jgi:hypothetical protein
MMMIKRHLPIDLFDLDTLKRLLEFKIISIEEAMQAKAFSNIKSSIKKNMLRDEFIFCSSKTLPDIEDDTISLDTIQRPFEALLERAKDDPAVKLTDPLKEVREQKGDFIYDEIWLYLENNIHPDHSGAMCGMRFLFKGKDVTDDGGEIELDENIYSLVEEVSDRLFDDIKNEDVSFGKFLGCFSDEVIGAWKRNNIKIYDGNSDSDLEALSRDELDYSLVIERSSDP